ncbi:hypothetical protein ACJX0J_012408, partial [Zea mays]
MQAMLVHNKIELLYMLLDSIMIMDNYDTIFPFPLIGQPKAVAGPEVKITFIESKVGGILKNLILI